MAKPSIPIPGALDLRVLQQAIGNIAERLRQLDGTTDTLTRYATGSKTASSLTILNQKIAELTARVNALGAGGGHAIEDDGTPVAQRAVMNFTGSAVSVADAGGKTIVGISVNGYFPGGWG